MVLVSDRQLYDFCIVHRVSRRFSDRLDTGRLSGIWALYTFLCCRPLPIVLVPYYVQWTPCLYLGLITLG